MFLKDLRVEYLLIRNNVFISPMRWAKKKTRTMKKVVIIPAVLASLVAHHKVRSLQRQRKKKTEKKRGKMEK